jgi:lipopolysaccharide export system permease protein
MSRILDRYIFREIATTWLGVTMVLLLILLTNQFARVLGDVAKGRLPKNAAFEVIGLSAVQYLTILVPIGLFLATMVALGRLYRDSELPAMMACRVGPSGIYRPLTWLMVPLVLGVAWLSIIGGPWALTAVDRIAAEARREFTEMPLRPTGSWKMFSCSARSKVGLSKLSFQNSVRWLKRTIRMYDCWCCMMVDVMRGCRGRPSFV